jgi:uncharacterized protein (DUF4415 family)
MPKSRKTFGSNFKVLDAHVITPEEYEEAPEWTDAQIAAADLHEGGRLIRRGRPPSPETRKQPVKIRLDPDLVAALRASGPGWQTRINELLRDVLRAKGVRGVRATLLARELRRELLGARGVRTAPPAPKAPRAPKLAGVAAKRAKRAARQHPEKAHPKKARA